MFDACRLDRDTYPGRQVARLGSDDRDALGGCCPTSRLSARPCRATRRTPPASARPRTRRPRSSSGSTRRSTRRSPIPTIKARLADLGGTPLRRLARRLRQAHRRRNRKVGQGDQVRRHQGGSHPASAKIRNTRSANGGNDRCLARLGRADHRQICPFIGVERTFHR